LRRHASGFVARMNDIAGVAGRAEEGVVQWGLRVGGVTKKKSDVRTRNHRLSEERKVGATNK